MLLYIETENDPDFEFFSERYRANPFAFPIAEDSALFAAALMETMAPRSDLAILETGCGQGQYLSGMVDVATELLGETGTPKAIGVDGSSVAIRQAAARDQRIDWVSDRLQHFVLGHDARFGERRYDLIMDRGGDTVISSAEEARWLLGHFARLLKPDGVYSYVISKSWYHSETRPEAFDKDWDSDWISIVREIFSGCEDHSTKGQYQLCFRTRVLR